MLAPLLPSLRCSLPLSLLLLLACKGDPHLDGFITDAEGGALVFHGVNVASSAKGSLDRLPVFEESDAALLASWGFNFVRYLILWDGLEPEPGVYNEEYLNAIEERLDWFEAQGIWVMLDMHQDVYSQVFCCDGAPEWAVRDDGEPFELQSMWFQNYLQPAVQRAFDNFWQVDGPHADLQESYQALWIHVAERLGAHPAVIGYDIINEPHPGSAWDGGEVINPKGKSGPSAEFDRNYLGPFYQRMIDAIRSADSDAWIFFESRYGAPADGSPSYLPKLTDPRRGSPRLAFAPHLYSVQMEAAQAYAANDTTIADWSYERGVDLEQQTGAPLLLGEWGLSPDWLGSADFIDELLTMTDSMMASWAYWSWDPGGWGLIETDGVTERPHLAQLIRPYPQRVAGRPLAWTYDASTQAFALSFQEVKGVKGDTRIFVPTRHYPNGWTLTCSDPQDTWSQSWDEPSQILTVTTDPKQEEHRLQLVAKTPPR